MEMEITIVHIHGLLSGLIEAEKRNSEKLDLLLSKGALQMTGISAIQAAQAAEKADLVTLTGFITQLLAAFASGSMTPEQAQATLDEINAEDATVKTNIASIESALQTASSSTGAQDGSQTGAAPAGSSAAQSGS